MRSSLKSVILELDRRVEIMNLGSERNINIIKETKIMIRIGIGIGTRHYEFIKARKKRSTLRKVVEEGSVTCWKQDYDY
jgi:hypothetical protein